MLKQKATVQRKKNVNLSSVFSISNIELETRNSNIELNQFECHAKHRRSPVTIYQKYGCSSHVFYFFIFSRAFDHLFLM